MHTRACSIRKVLLSQQVAKVECPEGKQSLCVQLKIEITGVSPQGEAVDCNSIEGFLMLGSIPRTPTKQCRCSSVARIHYSLPFICEFGEIVSRQSPKLKSRERYLQLVPILLDLRLFSNQGRYCKFDKLCKPPLLMGII